jgi:hypothetical protein
LWKLNALKWAACPISICKPHHPGHNTAITRIEVSTILSCEEIQPPPLSSDQAQQLARLRDRGELAAEIADDAQDFSTSAAIPG